MPIAEMIAAIGVDARQLTIAGQVAGLVSAVLLFFWGSAGWEITKEGFVSSPGVNLPLEHSGRKRAVFWFKVRYLVMSKVALVLLFASFLLQLLALWAPAP
ncbi:hypothetical protein MOQ18_14000 [Stenotrophomonas maltophilia]|uniref:hypothetical protein n=1 Tax=Stenotrophomonas maltophilia TaxID=40324 RepID=UPI001F53DF43|nr:hypothetical protein [Stenotrophomonas maltophilia]MCI1157277.1 hypothetical protein [Stenotrophomonas maltophilia]